VPTYRTGNNAYCIQSIGAAGGTGVAVANTASAIFGLQRQDLAYDTRTLERTYRDFTFDPAQFQGELGEPFTLPFTEDFASGTWGNWFASTNLGGPLGSALVVSGGAGVAQYVAGESPRVILAAAPVETTDQGVLLRVTFTGTSSLVVAVRADQAWSASSALRPNNGYAFSIGPSTAQVQSVVAGTVTGLSLTGTAPTTATAGIEYKIRFEVVGTTVRVRKWVATDLEPSTWGSVTNTAHAAGALQMGMSVGSVGQAVTLDDIEYYVPAAVPPATGSTAGSWEFTGTAAGSRQSQGSVAGTWSFAGTAAGQATKWGTASGSFAYAGAAVGDAPSVPPEEGSAAGSWTFVGTAAGSTTKRGTATGTVAFTGTASGTTQKRGTAVGGLTYTGTAVGSTVKRGTATGSIVWASEAAGTTVTRGTSSGLTTWAGTAVGDAPVPGLQEGAGAGSWVYTGAALGTTTKRGASVGTWNYTGTAVGDAPAILSPGAGTATGTWTFLGSATSGATSTPTPADRILLVPASQRIAGVSSRGLAGSVTYADRILPVYEDERMEEVVT
jgi:hypothetical protein